MLLKHLVKEEYRTEGSEDQEYSWNTLLNKNTRPKGPKPNQESGTEVFFKHLISKKYQAQGSEAGQRVQNTSILKYFSKNTKPKSPEQEYS